MALLFLNNHTQVFDNNGDPLANGTIEFYEVGTSTAKAVYSDKDTTVSIGSIVTLDGNGRETIFLVDEDYKVIIKDSSGTTIRTQDGGINPQSTTTSGNYNFIENSGFETDSNSDGVPDAWVITTYNGGSQTLDTSSQIEGAQSIKYTSTGNGGGYNISEKYFEVTEGTEYLVKFRTKSSVVDVRNLVQVRWYDASKVALSTSVIYDESTANPTSWAIKKKYASAPTNARFAKLEMYGCHSSDATAGSTWFDSVEFIENFQTVNIGSDVASASTVTIPDGVQYVDITGTTTITAISSNEDWVKLHFDGAVLLTHNITSLYLPGAANITTAAGDEAEFVQISSGNWRCTKYQKGLGLPVVPFRYHIFYHTTSGAVDGGGFTSGSWQTRPLNTNDSDYTDVTLSSNQLIVNAGTYIVCATAPAYNVNSHQTRLYNVTDSSTVLIGASERSSSTDTSSTSSLIVGEFTLTAQKTLEFQHRCETTKATNGMGVQSNFGSNNIYASITLLRIR